MDVYGVTSQTQAQRKWLSQFENAKALTAEYGDCAYWPETPGTRKTLRWIQTQRKKLEKGLLRQDEILKLRMIGVVRQEKDDPWMRVFRLAENYYRDNGNLEVPAHYVAKDGTRLGIWISKQRSLYRNTAAGKRLSDSQIQMLESIGMVWDAHRKAFDTGMRAAFRYYEANGNLEVPTRYVDDNGFPLYQWLCDVRKKKSKLREEDIRNLNLMQFSWERSQRNYS